MSTIIESCDKKSSTSLTKDKMVVVDYLGEKVKLESIPQTFADFNGWVISRFGISISEKISYRNLSDQGKSQYTIAIFMISYTYVIFVSLFMYHGYHAYAKYYH
jgi:hypothetical protein